MVGRKEEPILISWGQNPHDKSESTEEWIEPKIEWPPLSMHHSGLSSVIGDPNPYLTDQIIIDTPNLMVSELSLEYFCQLSQQN